MRSNYFLIFVLFLLSIPSFGQVSGRVVDGNKKGLPGVFVQPIPKANGVETNREGYFQIRSKSPIDSVVISLIGFQTKKLSVKELKYPVVLQELSENLITIHLSQGREKEDKVTLKSVEGAAIYASKKNEVIKPSQMAASLANNNPREIFSKVPGLNIWESDDGGIQLGVGARGLNPNRTAEFNTRLNGYDMSADALGYPETYYTPPADALARIEVVRGAASLQYGTQFGGMINFIHHQGPNDKAFEMKAKLSGGSFGFLNFFNSYGGTYKRVNYYAYLNYKRGDGWRPNSEYDFLNGYAHVDYKVSETFSMQFEATSMGYLAHQPGGLTDLQFEENPYQSNRSRNWFKVNWNLGAIKYQWKPNAQWLFDGRLFGLSASREALGFIGKINRTDDETQPRNLISDHYLNFGTEQRLLRHYDLGQSKATALVGVRYYRGFLDRAQGDAPSTTGPDFTFLNPDKKEGSDYDFPSQNTSVFAENVFILNEKWSITPGVRAEWINTASEGYYRIIRKDLAGNVIFDSVVSDAQEKSRAFVLLGLGASYKPNEKTEIYYNASQNYRAINFNDIRVVNPSFTVDPNMQDEKGFNMDIGIRGSVGKIITYDVSGFWLSYQNRIGTLLTIDPVKKVIVQYRTNISASNTFGVEGYADIYLNKLFNPQSEKHQLKWFVNATLLTATYTGSKDPSLNGNQVEWVPPFIFKSGLQYKLNRFKLNLLGSYTFKHYSDATNAEYDPSAIAGIIPSYYVMDLSAQYSVKSFEFGFSVNNLLDASYFSRRASGYPGPGIIPANRRMFILTVGYTL